MVAQSGVSSSFAQEYEDVVYLKDGGVRRGVIIEQIPGESLKLKTNYGEIFVISMSDIFKIAKEKKTLVGRKKSITSGLPKIKFSRGVQGGVGITSVRGNPYLDNLETAVGVTGAFIAEWMFVTHRFSFRTGITYQKKGAEAELTRSSERGGILGTTRYRIQSLHYMTVPLLVRLTFGDRWKYFGNAGPYLGYLIKDTIYHDGDSSQDIDNTHNDKRLDLGISSGVGVIIPITSPFLLTLELRNDLGLVNISKVPVIDSGSIKTNAFNFLIGVQTEFE